MRPTKSSLKITRTKNKSMNSREFFYLVSEMRNAQTDYFKTRSQRVLAKCRMLEKSVDLEIQRVKLIMEALSDGNTESNIS